MRRVAMIMGMPITIDVPGAETEAPIEAAFGYFREVDARFSPYKQDSELAALNRGDLPEWAWSAPMREVLARAETTRWETRGYFNVRRPDGQLDPSGLVKGWAICNAARTIADMGHADYMVDAGGDMQCAGHNDHGARWRIGIRNPFDARQSIKTLEPGDAGVATSGTSIRGQHIYDPHQGADLGELVSITVIAADIYDADRFATAAFAMGRDGIGFIETTDGLEAYAVDRYGIATMTSGFKDFVAK